MTQKRPLRGSVSVSPAEIGIVAEPSGAACRRLEGLCRRNGERVRIRFGAGTEGIERVEAALQGTAFAPHRHDTYAIGITVSGVQTFRYRGEAWRCLPGQLHILHPDEVHDGAPGTAAGFAYRILHVAPQLVSDALGDRELPFVPQPVHAARHPTDALLAGALDFETPVDELNRVEIATTVADLLAAMARLRPRRPKAAPTAAVARVKEMIAARPGERHPVAGFERVSGLDRFTLAREFRAAFGTSPSRFRTMRQLDVVRALLARGVPLASAAAEAGFADQAHMSRQFKRAYGLTPGVWAAALG